MKSWNKICYQIFIVLFSFFNSSFVHFPIFLWILCRFFIHRLVYFAPNFMPSIKILWDSFKRKRIPLTCILLLQIFSESVNIHFMGIYSYEWIWTIENMSHMLPGSKFLKIQSSFFLITYHPFNRGNQNIFPCFVKTLQPFEFDQFPPHRTVYIEMSERSQFILWKYL